MIRPFGLAFLAALAPAFFLLGCIADGAGKTPQHQGPLFACTGLPGYDGDFQDIIRDLKANPPVCQDGEPVSRKSSAQDSTRVHAYVMDSQCGFIKDYEVYVSPEMRWNILWDATDADGKPLPTGEYYVNVVTDRGSAGKDTAYSKFGYIRSPCAL